ncbi:MAG: hypothetical protein HYR85_26475 [Planctomycetes bacterium]|nr:hypothetical protein [Planctomycetota bacterium]MBI3848435.1 hypothetical protein [Planctomycetota bacterium]
MKTIWLVVLLALLAIVGLGIYRWSRTSAEREPAACEVCERPIHRATAFSINVDSREVWACCPRCGLSLARGDGDRPPQARATDYPTGRLVPADHCVFVEGADIAPCCSPDVIVGAEKVPTSKCFDRCYPSAIAFEKPQDAADYSRKHGGTIVSFETLFREVKKS